MSDPIDTAMNTLDVAFGEVAALAAAERRTHPDPLHYKEVDGALEALRVQVRACRDSARVDRSVGNTSTAAHTLSKARALVSDARRVWEARVAAAEAAAGRERERRNAAAADFHAGLRAGGAVSRKVEDFGLREACRLLRQRVEMLEPAIDADAADFKERLDDLDSAVKSIANAIGVALREHRLRVAAQRADAAVAARLAA